MIATLPRPSSPLLHRLGDSTLGVLAPPGFEDRNQVFAGFRRDPQQRQTRLEQIQRFRGKIYCEDGAIRPWDLDENECHRVDLDNHSWHFFILNARHEMTGCLRVAHYDGFPEVNRLKVKETLGRLHPEISEKYRKAIGAFLHESLEKGWSSFAEIGGWAVHKSAQNCKALLLICAGWALAGLFDFVVLATAARRNNSSRILRRMGGFSLVHENTELGPVYDPYYACEIEIMGFEPTKIHPRFEDSVQVLKTHFQESMVVVA
jgi:hypothetical protein